MTEPHSLFIDTYTLVCMCGVTVLTHTPTTYPAVFDYSVFSIVLVNLCEWLAH